MQRGLSLSMIGRGLSWADIWIWLTNPPAGSQVAAWGVKQEKPSARESSHTVKPPAQPPTRTPQRPQLSASEVRARVAQRTE
ncbi:hypothetical protein [uncultured Corynebacterium sp.]|uniref:hypothetical protein n=1 Tax=uncultured Corynebacterium sp. TaxID=159447 RepID=UPI0025E26F42|nr:hypothetical protein [uncultured Corynebacterium sp.]